MNKFMCPGTYVTSKLTNKSGKVVIVDRKTQTAIVKNEGSYWSERTKNLEVTSYKEVE